MDANAYAQLGKPHGFWGILKDKTLLIVAGLIGSVIAAGMLWLLNWSGIGIAAGMTFLWLGAEILRLRNERRWHRHRIEILEQRLKGLGASTD